MTVKGGTSPACAACKYQRRKCTADCPLAPYFPPDDPKQFQNAHRLFGVSNILKILKHLDPHQKLEAMRSIVFQANMRDKYPVHGCVGVIGSLQYQILQTQQELDMVNAQLALFRQHHQQMSSAAAAALPPSSQLQLAPATALSPNNSSLNLFHNHPHHHQLNEMAAGIATVANAHLPFANASTVDSSSNSNTSNQINNNNYNDNVNQLWHQYSYHQLSNYYNNSPALQSQYVAAAQPLACQQQATVATHGYDEMNTFLDTIDDRQSYVDSKEAYDSSPESSLKGATQSMEHVGENNLNTASTSCLTAR